MDNDMDKKPTLKIQLLQYIAAAGTIQRSRLRQPFTKSNYRYYAQTLKSLIDDGYVIVIRERKRNYLEVTKLGKKELESKNIELGNVAIMPIINKTNSKITDTRRKLYAEAAGMCFANGYHVSDHARLEFLYGHGTKEEQQEAKKLFIEQLKDGIYYEVGELRVAQKNVYGKSEIANQTRMVGILFVKQELFYVYCIGDSLITWKTTCEERAVQFYLDFLAKSNVICQYVHIEKHPRAIIIGSSLKMIPAIVYGRKNGIRRTDIRIDTVQESSAKGRISSENLAQVFSAAYFVPSNKMGISMLKAVCTVTDNVRDILFTKWLDKHGYMRLSSKRYYQGVDRNTGNRFIFAPYIDLIEFRYYKLQDEVAHFIIPNGTQEAVSRVMGPLLKSAENMRGAALKFKPCDANGVILDGNWLYVGGM